MLDIGFAELLVVSAIALFVVGPERLPSALRSMSLWVGRVRRGFEEIKADVSREMHNEEVMRALKESRDEVQDIADVSSALSIEPPTTINTTANTAIDTATDTATDSETLPDKGA
jgi:sec-independent protein translocase protein TatB